MRRGHEDHQAGRLLQAGAYYRQVLDAQPNHPDALHLLGVVELQMGEHEAAADLIQRAIAVQPDFADAHANLGYVLTLQRKFDAAVAALRRAVALKPQHTLAWNNLGNALMSLGGTHEAIAAYRRALSIDPAYADAHFNLGCALRDWGSLDAAAASIQAALRTRDDFAEAHYTLGLVDWERGRLNDSAAHFRAALATRPQYAEAYFQLHAVALDLEGPQAAIECLERAVQLKPAETGFRFFLGTLLDPAAAASQFALLSKESALDRARLAGWQYIQSSKARMVGSPVRAFELALQAARGAGLVLEFGVRMGGSIRQIAALAGGAVHGFDSFEGIPEDWHGEARGSYSTLGELPEVPANVTLHAGWFDQSLPRFLAEHAGPVRFANIDCDLYSSTRTVLGLLRERIVPGTVLVFDEYLGYEHWQEDEFKAFHKAVQEYGWRYRYLGFSFITKQAVIQIS